MTVYERVTYRPEPGAARTLILADPKVSAALGIPVLSGSEVDRDGCPLDRIQVIDLTLIVRRTPLRMDLTYARLVPTEGAPGRGWWAGYVEEQDDEWGEE